MTSHRFLDLGTSLTTHLVTRRVRQAIVAALVLTGLFAGPLANAANLEGIDFASLPGDKTEIRMRFDTTPPQPSGYTIEQPARIVLDMPGVTTSLSQKHHTLGAGNARRVSVIGAGDRTRAIVNLTSLVGYETRVEGNLLLLVVGTDQAGAPVTTTATEEALDQAVLDNSLDPNDRGIDGSHIQNVDFCETLSCRKTCGVDWMCAILQPRYLLSTRFSRVLMSFLLSLLMVITTIWPIKLIKR